MPATEQRHTVRESTFQLADLQIGGAGTRHRVKVRNLSKEGMMGEGRVPVVPGSRITVQLESVGQVKGTVAWVQQDRFGVAFDEEIDLSVALGG